MLPIIFLHGALGAASELLPIADVLRNDFDVHLLDFPGHGGAPMPEQGFNLNFFSDEAIRFMDAKGIRRGHLFGYSMGGCVGMLAAQASPERIASVATLGTKYLWDEASASAETRKLDPEKISEKVPAFAQSLAAKHGAAQWKETVHATRAMIQGLGAKPPFPEPESDLAAIAQPCLIMVGDADTMVPVEETRKVQQMLPQARLAVLPGTPHPVGKVDVDMLAFHLRRFFAEVDAKA